MDSGNRRLGPLFRAGLPISLALLTGGAWAQTSCDLNGDGVVDLVDVQLMDSWQPPAACPQSVNVVSRGICSDLARQVVLNAALGRACHYVELNWKPSTSPGIAGYNIYRGTEPHKLDPQPLNSAPVTGTSYNDATVRDGIKYYYSIRAVDGKGQSELSEEASATVP